MSFPQRSQRADAELQMRATGLRGLADNGIASMTFLTVPCIHWLFVMRRVCEMSTNDLLELAKSLGVTEKVALVEGLLAELDRPDASIDSEWAAESESRLAAYRKGEIRALPLAKALEKILSK